MLAGLKKFISLSLLFLCLPKRCRKGAVLALYLFGSMHSYGQNQTKIDSLSAIIDQGVHDTLKIHLWNQLADEYNNTDSVKTAFYVEKSIALGEEIGYHRGIGDAYYMIAWSNIMAGNYEIADQLCSKALAIAESHDYKRGIALCYNGLGVIQRRKGDYSKALRFHFKSLNLREELNDQSGMASSYHNIGYLYNVRSDYREAINYLEKSLTLKIENRLISGISNTYNHIGNSYFGLEDYQKAYEYYLLALEVIQEGNTTVLANSLLTLGKTLMKLGRYNEAQVRIEESLTIAQKLENKSKTSIAYSILGENYYLQGDLNNARKQLEAGYAIAQLTGDPNDIKTSTERLTKVHYSLGNYQKAYEFGELNTSITLQIQNDEITKEIAFLTAEYAFDKTRDSLEFEQEKERLAFLAELDRRKFIQRTTYFGLAAALVFAVVVLYFYQSKKRSNEQLVHLNGEIQHQNEVIRKNRDDLKQALDDLEQTQSKLIESEKMASLGILSAGLGHEINNPLNFIKGGIYGIRKKLNELTGNLDQDTSKYLSVVDEGIERASSILASLDNFSRINSREKQSCDLHQIIDRCILSLQTDLNNRIKLEKNYSLTESTISGYEGRLQQAFINILTNAIQAIKDSGTISIRTAHEDGNLKVEIMDDGMGIHDDDLNRIMDLFFTTKDPGQGTGLGLPIAYKIIEEHDGSIEVESELGKGTCFTLIFPAEIQTK